MGYEVTRYVAKIQEAKALLLDCAERSVKACKSISEPSDAETETILGLREKAMGLDASIEPMFPEPIDIAQLRERLRFVHLDIERINKSIEKDGDRLTAGQKGARLHDLVARAMELTDIVRDREDQSDDSYPAIQEG